LSTAGGEGGGEGEGGGIRGGVGDEGWLLSLSLSLPLLWLEKEEGESSLGGLLLRWPLFGFVA
jgi:hypothetical protein